MSRKLMVVVLAGAMLGLAGSAQAKPPKRWVATPVPHRPLLPVRIHGLWYDDPGAMLRIGKGTGGTLPNLSPSQVLAYESNWYPIGSRINVRLPAHSTLGAQGPDGTAMPAVYNMSDPTLPSFGSEQRETHRCRWGVPTVVDALKLIEAPRISGGTRDYIWRVRGTNRGNELWVRLVGPDAWVMQAVNYSNAPVRVTVRCIASGPQESLVRLSPGVWVANPWVDLLYWPDPNFPQVMPPTDERWECTDPAILSDPNANGPHIAQACQALGWS